MRLSLSAPLYLALRGLFWYLDSVRQMQLNAAFVPADLLLVFHNGPAVACHSAVVAAFSPRIRVALQAGKSMDPRYVTDNGSPQRLMRKTCVGAKDVPCSRPQVKLLTARCYSRTLIPLQCRL